MLPASMLYDRLAQLPLTIDGYRLERLEQAVTSGFVRVTTLVVAQGGGLEGIGEDVTYTAADHDGFPLDLPLAGTRLAGRGVGGAGGDPDCSRRPEMPASDDYRRWAVESAVLDLALKQSGPSLASARRPASRGRCGSCCPPVTASTTGSSSTRSSSSSSIPRRLGRRADRPAGRHRPRARARPEGVLPRHRVDIEPDPDLYRDARRALSRHRDRGRRAGRALPRRAVGGARPAQLRRARSTRWPTSTRCRCRRAG